MSLLVCVKFGNLALCLGCNHKHLGIFVLYCLTHCIYVGIASGSARVVNVAHIQHRFIGQQEQFARYAFLLLACKLHLACIFAFRQHLLIAFHHFVLHFSITVASLCLFLYTAYAALYGLQIAQLKLCVNHALVTHWVNRTVNVCHIAVVKAPQHVYYSVGLTNVCQKLVAKTLSL